MRLIHTSPEKITKISSIGSFDDCLFFSDSDIDNAYAMGPVHAIYSIEIADEKVIDVFELYDTEIIEHIADVLDVDTDAAERMLDGRDTAFDHGKDGEQDWWIQARQGECAKKMGYEAVAARDEQGTCYIVPMIGRESDLVCERLI